MVHSKMERARTNSPPRSRDRVAGSVFPYPEKLLQFIWQEQLFDTRDLRTVSGLPLVVLRPGRIQHFSGPDLDGASLVIDGERWEGPVEVHVRSTEWEAHGHHRDPAYDQVILHVVMHACSDRSICANGRPVEVLSLRDRLDTGSLNTYERLMNAREMIGCARFIDKVPQALRHEWMEDLLLERLLRRSMQVRSAIDRSQGDQDQVVHELIAKAFGGPSNGLTFGRLAKELPVRLLWRYRDDPWRSAALVQGVSGLWGGGEGNNRTRELTEFNALARMHRLSVIAPASWLRRGARPVSTPAVRIAQWLALVQSLEGSWQELLGARSAMVVREELMERARVIDRENWCFERMRGQCRIGKQLAERIIINAFVPVLLEQAARQGAIELRDRAFSWLDELPSERNAVVTEWSALGLGPDSAAGSQALLELRELYCRPRRCLFCKYGRNLMSRS
ncbi:MAG: DUF2851 family protein [Flavobacteriales bacterium]|nr:DUF2851 family protein [Flavobacteriales bacterium]